MTNRWLLALGFLALACSAPPRPQPPPPAPPPVYVEYEMHGELAPGGTGEPTSGDAPIVGTERDQPPHIKLKLGHYRNARLRIGLTIDLTEMTESIADIDPAKLRFDGDDTIYRLQGQYGGRDRIDYVRDDGRVMLQMTRGGRVTVYIRDPETDRAEPVDVVRDGDADPL